MKRAIITGATGFVGANLARRLLRDGHEVHLLVRPKCPRWRIESIQSNAAVHEADLHDAAHVARTVADVRPEWIFHLAAYGAYSSQTDREEMIRTNVQGTLNLLEAGLKTGFEAFVNTGSSSEYGFKDHAPKETEPAEPNSDYAVTKANATYFCGQMARRHGVKVPTLRLYSVYGPFEEPTRLMPTLILKGLRGELPPLVEPELAHDYVATEDVCDAYLLAAQSGGNDAVYNVGTGIQTTMSRVVEVARKVLKIKAEPKWGSMPNRKWDTAVWVADSEKIQRELGWKPRTPFEEGFGRMADWLRSDPKLLEHYQQAADLGLPHRGRSPK
jgi:nucleoside-diphosphate-sugar epimerase